MQLAAAATIAMFLVVTSGAFVRLTASGLGCDHWPRCGTAPFPTQGNQHAIIEFSNRMVALVGIALALITWLASRKVQGLSRLGRCSALGAFLGALAQIPLGGVTIILDLHPLAVMSHFLLALVVLALSVVVVLEAWGGVAGRAPALRAGVGASCGRLGGAAARRGARRHRRRGDRVRPAPRLGEGRRAPRACRSSTRSTSTCAWRPRSASGSSCSGSSSGAAAPSSPVSSASGAPPSLVLVAQMILGEVQYRNALPWGLVLVHVFLAATIWSLSVVIAYVLWRPPADARRRAEAACPCRRAPVGQAVRE